jgi:hypothetical protein
LTVDLADSRRLGIRVDGGEGGSAASATFVSITAQGEGKVRIAEVFLRSPEVLTDAALMACSSRTDPLQSKHPSRSKVC